MKIIILIGLLFSTSFCNAQTGSRTETTESLPSPQVKEINTQPVAIPQPMSFIYETLKPPPGREVEVRKAEEKAYRKPVPEFPPVITSPAEAGKLPNE